MSDLGGLVSSGSGDGHLSGHGAEATESHIVLRICIVLAIASVLPCPGVREECDALEMIL